MGKFEAAYAVFTNIHYQVQLKSQGKMQGAEETRLTRVKSMIYLLEASSFQIHNYQSMIYLLEASSFQIHNYHSSRTENGRGLFS